MPDIYADEEALGCSTIPTYSEAELQQRQRSDPGHVVNLLEAGDGANPNPSPDSLELKLMLKESKRLEL